MKKALLYLVTVSLMISMLLSLSPLSRAAEPWTPGTNVSGFSHIQGQTLNLTDSFILLNIESVRVDLWGKGSDPTNPTGLVISITIVNETNVFDAALPADLAAAIETYAASLPEGVTIKIETLWDFLKLAIPLAANLASELGLQTKKLTSSDYAYLDEALLVYNPDITLVIAKDQRLAVIAASFPTAPNLLAEFSANFQTTMTELMDELNLLIENGINGAGLSRSQAVGPQSAAIQYDANVLSVVNGITKQYGTNGPAPGPGIPGFPPAILISISLFSLIPVVKHLKKRM
jgi:hypothetical protein